MRLWKRVLLRTVIAFHVLSFFGAAAATVWGYAGRMFPAGCPRAAMEDLIGLLMLDFALRLYIGKAAVHDGRRLKKKRFTYVVLAIIVAASLTLNLVQRCIALGSNKVEIWANVMASANVSVIVDITSLLALIEMIVAAIMVRRLRRELGISGKEAE